MNFYKHHIGDYAAATGHLSILEDGCYSRLLRLYYRDEKPLPGDIKAVQRLAGARSKEEKNAVATVLQEFFYLCEEGFRSKRCDEELAKANSQAETNKRIAEEREARRRAARDKTDDSRTVTRSEHESFNEACDKPEHESLSSREPSQTPDSRHQTPDKSSSIPSLTTQQAPTERGRACLLMRQVGCTQTNPSNPALIAALDEGITPETLADYARAAIEAGKQKPFGYAITAARSDRAQGVPPPGANNHANHSSPGRKLSVVEQVERNIADRKQREATTIDGESKRVGN